MKHILLTLTLVLAISIPVQADTETAKTEALNEMFVLMGMEEQMLGGFDAMLPMVNQLAAQLQLDAAATEELKEIYRAWFLEDLDREAMKTQIMKVYADAFTAEEIKELNEFYRSDVGKKLLKANPELTRQGAEIGMLEAQKKQGQLMLRLQPFLVEHRPSAVAP